VIWPNLLFNTIACSQGFFRLAFVRFLLIDGMGYFVEKYNWSIEIHPQTMENMAILCLSFRDLYSKKEECLRM